MSCRDSATNSSWASVRRISCSIEAGAGRGMYDATLRSETLLMRVYLVGTKDEVLSTKDEVARPLQASSSGFGPNWMPS